MVAQLMMLIFFQIQIFRNTSMTFINNEAVNRGGGLSASSASSLGIDTDIIRLFNTRCFIQYDLSTKASFPPELWNVSLIVSRCSVFYIKCCM